LRESFGTISISSPSLKVGIGSLEKEMSGQRSFHVNLFTRWCIVIRVSSLANSYPGHMRAPPPNATKLYGGIFVSKWFGSNFVGSGKRDSSMCVMEAAQVTWVKKLKLSIGVTCYHVIPVKGNKHKLDHTCHPLGIRYPLYSRSSRTFLKELNTGGNILRHSNATLHVYFILARSSHVKSSPEALLLATSSCSAVSDFDNFLWSRVILFNINWINLVAYLEQSQHKQLDHLPSV